MTRLAALAIALGMLAAACGTQEPASSTTTQPPPTDAPATTPPTTTPPTIDPGLPSAPWSVPPLPAEAAPTVLRASWDASSSKGSCGALYPANANDLAADAVVRTAEFGDDAWAIAWDRPEGPGRSEDGSYCEECGRGAFGIAGVKGSDPFDVAEVWSQRLEWSDGSVAGYGLEGAPAGEGAPPGAPYLSFLAIPGQGCSYNVWSFLGEDHLFAFIDELRFVEGMLAAVVEADPDAGSAEALGPAPWLRAAVGADAVPEALRLEWAEEVLRKETCPLLSPVTLGDVGQNASARRATNSGELLAAWDKVSGPGRYGTGDYCADCGRGAFGIGTITRNTDAPTNFERFAVTHTWDDGSELRVIDEGIEVFNTPPGEGAFTDPQTNQPAAAPHNGYLLIPGLGCGYRLWSFYGPEAVVELAQALRPVIGFGDAVFTDGVCPPGSAEGDFDGDGSPERFHLSPPLGTDESASVIVCREGGGAPLQFFVSGLGEALVIADLDRDRDVEVLAGATSTTAVFLEVIQYDASGETFQLGLDDGPFVLTEGVVGTVGHRWGCRTDGTVVQVEGTLSGRTLRWTRTAYRIDGFMVEQVGSGTGSTPVSTTDLADAIFEDAVTGLVGNPRCGG